MQCGEKEEEGYGCVYCKSETQTKTRLGPCILR